MSPPSRVRPRTASSLVIEDVAACSGENSGDTVTTNAQANAPTGTSAADVADGKMVLAFGDSLYAGYGVGADESFPADLQKALVARGISATVSNAGVSGDTSAAGLRRLAFTLDGLPRKPDLALVNLGGNDMLRGIDPAETRANLTAICAELSKRGIPIMLTGMVAAPNMGRAYTDAFNPIYADLAKRFDAPLYPFFLDGVITDRALMLPDGVHPNPKGIDIIVARVAPIVAARLK